MVAVTMFNWPSVARMLHSREVPQGTPQNDELQRTSHRQNGGSPLISVLAGRRQFV
jgi:hypothetical protein